MEFCLRTKIGTTAQIFKVRKARRGGLEMSGRTTTRVMSEQTAQKNTASHNTGKLGNPGGDTSPAAGGFYKRKIGKRI